MAERDKTTGRFLPRNPPSFWQKLRDNAFVWGALGVGATLVAAVIPEHFRWLALLAAFPFFAMAAFGAASHAGPRHTKRLVGYGGTIIAAAALAALYIFVVLPPQGEEPPSRPIVIPEADHIGLFLECGFGSPQKMPPEGRGFAVIFSFEQPTQEKVSQGLPFGEFVGEPGSDFPWNDVNFYASIFECTITNYSQKPLFGVVFPVSITYRAIKADGGGSGDIILTSKSLIRFPRITIGEDKPIKFFIFNKSPFYIFIKFESNVIVSADPGGTQTTVRVTQNIPLGAVVLAPPVSVQKTTNPPASSPPNPTPQGMPTKK